MSHHFERNPFATRYVRPGTVGYRFTGDSSPVLLIERLRKNDWWGEIIGPHGSGKSTLLQSLLPLMQQAGRNVRAVTLHQGESQLPFPQSNAKQWNPETQLVIDGYEQLSRANRSRIIKLCQDMKCGLLITSHEQIGLPPLYSTPVSLELVQSLVRDLQQGGPTRISDADVAKSFDRHHGNVRDVFFELYDIFEQRRPFGEV